jgi:hypothetical protein
MVYNVLTEMATRRRNRGGGICGSKKCPIKSSNAPASASASATRPTHVKLNEAAAATQLAKQAGDIAAKQRQIDALKATIAAKVADIRATPEEQRAKRVRILKSKKLDDGRLKNLETQLAQLKKMKETFEATIRARRQLDVAIGLGQRNAANTARATLRRLNTNMARRVGPALQTFKKLSRNQGLKIPSERSAAGIGLPAIANSSSSNASLPSLHMSSSGSSVSSKSGNSPGTKTIKAFLREEKAKAESTKRELKASLAELKHTSDATNRAIASFGKTIERSMGIPSNAELEKQLAEFK